MYEQEDIHWEGPPTTWASSVEGMTPGFAVFNLHVNNAGARADAEFQRIFGTKAWQRTIKPYQDDGIMAILEAAPTPHRAAWIALVTAFVNERTP